MRLFNKLYGVAIHLDMIMCTFVCFFYIIIHTGWLVLLQGQRKSLIKRPINDAPNPGTQPDLTLPPPLGPQHDMLLFQFNLFINFLLTTLLAYDDIKKHGQYNDCTEFTDLDSFFNK